jgi:hypothetical protein
MQDYFSKLSDLVESDLEAEFYREDPFGSCIDHSGTHTLSP